MQAMLSNDDERFPKKFASEASDATRIEERIRHLIQQYLYTRSPAIALSVVRHVEELCGHPTYEGGPDQRCDYLRMRKHWCWLASEGG